jgi:putative NADPH-quinone reductase
VRVLVLFCHPVRESFVGSAADALVARLREDGHEVELVDLYGEGFDPVLGADAWRDHRADRGHPDGLARHIEALREAEGLALVFPTWWYGLPAMLKGWFDRVWQPQTAFAIESGGFRIHYLARLRAVAAITTCGSPRGLIEILVGNPVRRQVMRGLALQFARGARKAWASIYDVDRRSPDDLAGARERAVHAAARAFA